MKALSSGFDSNGKSLKQNAEQQKILSEQVKNQESRVEAAKNMVAKATAAYEENKRQLEAAKTAYGENSEEVQSFEKALESNSQKIQKYQTDLNNATADLNKLKGQLDNMPSSLDLVAAKFEAMGKKLEDIGSKMTSVGTKLTTTITAPIVAFATKGVLGFAEVDKTMQLTNATMGNTAEQAKLLDDAMKSAAANSTFGMSDAATATLNYARAGLEAEQAAAALAPAMNLAAGEGGNLDTVSAGLVATINGFGDSFDRAGRYADVFAAACNNSALDVDSLSEALSVAAPIFSAAGYSVEDATLYMGTMANAGIEASVAANALKTGFARLVSPAKEGSEAMEALGLSVTNADGSMKDSVTLQAELHDAFSTLSESEQIAAASAIFGKNQMSNWLALINTAPADVESLALELDGASIDLDDFAQKLDNSGLSIDDMKSKLSKVGISSETFDKALKASQGNAADFADYLWQAANDGTTLDDVVDALGGDLGNLQGIMDNTAGTTDVMAEAMMSGFGGSLEKLKSSLDVLMVDMGRLISGHLTPIITKIQEWVDAFNAMDDSEKEQVIRIAAIAAAIGPLLVTGGKLLTGVGKIMQFAPQISTALQGVSSIFGGFSTSLIGALAPITAIVAVIGVLVAAFMNLWNNNEAFRTNMIATWESIKASFAGFIEQIQERLPAIQEAFTNFIEFVRPLWEAFCQVLAPMFEGAFSMVATVLQTVFNLIISVIDMLLGIFTMDKELFMTGLTEFLTAIVTFLTTMLNLIWTTILNVVNVILSFFGTSLQTLKTNITTAFTNIVTSVQNKITEFRDLIFEKVGEVVDYISELPGKFLQWGTDMINNLIAGIRSGIDAVGEAVGAVAEKISSFLHFSEPDVGPLANFNSWMPDMMKQMADQIEAGRLQVQLAASHVAADIAAPMETAQNFTLNNSFTFNGGYTEADGREIVRRINRELGSLYI